MYIIIPASLTISVWLSRAYHGQSLESTLREFVRFRTVSMDESYREGVVCG